MGKAEEMAAALKAKQEQEQEWKVKLQATMDDWPVQINGLLTAIEGWLAPLTQAGLSVTRTDIAKTEEPDFRYTTQKLTIRSGNQTAVVEPFALFMIGMGGRVDFRLGGLEIGLILSTDGSNKWQALVPTKPPATPQLVPFDEDFFLERLAKYLNI